MTRSQKKEWNDYIWSNLMAVAFSVPTFVINPSFFGNVPFLPKVFLWGFGFGTSIYVGKTVTSRIHYRSFLATVLVQSLLVLLSIIFAFVFCFTVLGAWDTRTSPWNPNLLRMLARVMIEQKLYAWMGASFLAVMVFSAIFQISRKMGPGVLRGWILGKYHEPREEVRIFMFLDMKDSTTLAERLGALRFSGLVRDFFNDLTEPVIESQANVSHYIGDEAVLTWTLRHGLDHANCIHIFFLFEERLEKRRAYYEAKYGFVPEFKAGAHVGPVVATEVGQIKSEIVFHGDVMNTAARIQGMCNGFDQGLLISGELQAMLKDLKSYEAVSRGRHLLKGKEHDIEIFAVGKAGTLAPTPEIRAPGETVARG